MSEIPDQMEEAVELACTLLKVESLGDELTGAIVGSQVYRHLAASHANLNTVNDQLGYRSDRGDDEYTGLVEQLRLDARRELGQIITEHNIPLETFFGTAATIPSERGCDGDILMVDNGWVRQRYAPDQLSGYEPELGEEVWVTREFDEDKRPDLPEGYTQADVDPPEKRRDVVDAHVVSKEERLAEKREAAPARYQ